MNEIWKDIEGYEGFYQVSNHGRVKSLDRIDSIGRARWGRIRKPGTGNGGYLFVPLSLYGKEKNHDVHVLVAHYFVGARPGSLVVDHIDENKKNNHFSNLRYITNRANTNRGKTGYTSKYAGVGWHKASKRWRARIHIDGKRIHLGNFESEEAAAQAYNYAFSMAEKAENEKK